MSRKLALIMSSIKQSYLNQRYSGSFSSLSGFVKNRKKWSDKEEVAKELRKLRGYALHGNVRYKFPRRRIIINFLHQLWSSDLKVLSKADAKENKIGYLLVVIDGLSKYAWIRPLKDKTPKSMITVKSIFREANTTPLSLMSDRGKEYVSNEFQKFLDAHKIKWLTSFSEIKASHAERFISTIYRRIARFVTEKQSRRFVHKLQDFIKSYNATYHRSIGMSPNQVTPQNAHEVWSRMYRNYIEEAKKPRKPPKYKEGQLVRLSKSRAFFHKG